MFNTLILLAISILGSILFVTGIILPWIISTDKFPLYILIFLMLSLLCFFAFFIAWVLARGRDHDVHP